MHLTHPVFNPVLPTTNGLIARVARGDTIIEARAPTRNFQFRPMNYIRPPNAKLHAFLLQITPGKLPISPRVGARRFAEPRKEPARSVRRTRATQAGGGPDLIVERHRKVLWRALDRGYGSCSLSRSSESHGRHGFLRNIRHEDAHGSKEKTGEKNHNSTSFHITKATYIARANDQAGHCFADCS